MRRECCLIFRHFRGNGNAGWAMLEYLVAMGAVVMVLFAMRGAMRNGMRRVTTEVENEFKNTSGGGTADAILRY